MLVLVARFCTSNQFEIVVSKLPLKAHQIFRFHHLQLQEEERSIVLLHLIDLQRQHLLVFMFIFSN